MPPNRDALTLHIDRCNYVSFIWRRCLRKEIGAPDFLNYGWKEDEHGKVSVKWLSGLSAMDTILESANCKCKAGCKTRKCGYKKEDLECTELCLFSDCQNQRNSNVNEDDDDDFYQNDIEMDNIDIE